ncbi:MAG: DNA-processing protein DprA [Tannerella sp.]|jgi:DNA processing protein|nr:DNA-processing protein DprA [Tannerella sp.]
MEDDSRKYFIALTLLNGVGNVLARHLLQFFGSAEAIFSASRKALEKVPGIGVFTAEQIELSKSEALKRADTELIFADKNKIRIFTMLDSDYPQRLKECPDAPITFYYRGNSNLNAEKIISIVGTRKITDYGKKVTEIFVQELAKLFPELLIVSGLAYGVDVSAHRNALKNNLPTVGVLAHGLDRIYPAAHRNIAVEMLGKGGLLTDFMSGTNPDRENFLQRNRLIAGLADATVIVESAEKGGALITADIAFSYGRDVFAFPGRVTDLYSAGCNRLITMNKAGLISSAKDLMMALCWDKSQPQKSQQTSISFAEKPDHPILKLLAEKGEFQINELAITMNTPVHKLMQTLFELELEGHIKALPGGVYRLG